MSKKKLLPRVVYQMCVHGALITGSFAKKLAGEDIVPEDFDLLVPLEKWQTVALMIPETAKPNKFGGWRFETEHGDELVEVDVWPDTVQNYLTNCKSEHGGRVCVVDFIGNRLYSAESVAL